MNSKIIFFLAPLAWAGPALLAQDKAPEASIPVTQAPPRPEPAAPAEGDYQQRLYGPAAGGLISPDKANQIVNAFRAAYEKSGKPRVLIYVNRELVDENSGLKLSSRSEKTVTKQSETRSDTSAKSGSADATTAPGNTTRSAKVTGENRYTATDKAAPTLADKQTVREVERLFGRPFRAAGATLADQKTAAALMADMPLDHFSTPATNETARKDREAVAKIADVVVEILISSRSLQVPEVSGDRTVSVPDIQVTAVRLSDSAIIGQAAASDVLGKDQQAGRLAGRVDIRDITEATALALMDDMTQAAK